MRTTWGTRAFLAAAGALTIVSSGAGADAARRPPEPFPDRAEVQSQVPKLSRTTAGTQLESVAFGWDAPSPAASPNSSTRVDVTLATGHGKYLGDLGVVGLSVNVSLRNGTSVGQVLSVTDRAKALKAVSVRTDATHVWIKGKLPASLLKLSPTPGVLTDVSAGLPLDLAVTLPAGHLTGPTDALVSGATLTRGIDGTTFAYSGSRQAPLEAGSVTGSLGSFSAASAEGAATHLWKEQRHRPGWLTRVSGDATESALDQALQGSIFVHTLADLTADGSLASTSGVALPGNRHLGHFGAYLEGTRETWVSDDAEFKSDVRDFACAAPSTPLGQCTEVPVLDEGYGGLGVGQTFAVDGSTLRFGVGMPAGDGVVQQTLDVAVRQWIPTLTVQISSPRAGVLAYRETVQLVASRADYSGTIGSLPATAQVLTPLSVESMIDEWEAPSR